MEKLRKEFLKLNIDTFGICDASLYNCAMGTDYSCCIVALFPYFCGYKENSNLSIYTHGTDYHIVTRRVLTEVAENCGISDYKVHADTGPYIERQLAVNAGIAFMGRNGLCINSKYGSYFFIGYIVCNMDYKKSPMSHLTCMNCGRCIAACPSGALTGGFCIEKCLSAITQKRGELTCEELSYVKRHNTVFGCDICQKACPHNANVPFTDISDFKEGLISKLEYKDIENLSERQFRKNYKDRAFSWRGLAPLKRNLLYRREEENEDSNT